MTRKNKLRYQVLKQDDEESPQKGKKQQRLGGGASTRRRAASRRKVEGDDESFRRMIEDDGTMSISEMAADGNCLFRSLSDQLYWDYGDNHEEIRSDICDFLALQKDEFSVFLVLDENEEDEDAADFESYVSNMRKSGQWGGNLELVAAARLYRRNIKLFSSAAAYTIEHGAKESAAPDLMVSYHDNDHYNSVHNKNAKKPPPPVKMMPLRAETWSVTSTDSAQVGEGISPSIEVAFAGSLPDVKADETIRPSSSASTARKKGKKSGACPCNSGDSYRKCCGRKEKSRKKIVHNSSVAGGTEEPAHEHLVENGFKVLKI